MDEMELNPLTFSIVGFNSLYAFTGKARKLDLEEGEEVHVWIKAQGTEDELPVLCRVEKLEGPEFELIGIEPCNRTEGAMEGVRFFGKLDKQDRVTNGAICTSLEEDDWLCVGASEELARALAA